jgi:hypothetical protein
MWKKISVGLLLLILSSGMLPFGESRLIAAEGAPGHEKMTDANTQRLVLDDMEDTADWYNGSPEETQISASTKHVKQGTTSLLFANVVDHTKGEKNYPVGWPRTGKDLGKGEPTDFSQYDFFECWIYVETDRESLPGNPLGIGFYHSGPKRSTSFPLNEVKKDAWVKIVIPLDQLHENAADVNRVQLNISESNYKHGDRVDFYVDDVVLTRFIHPVVAELDVDRNVLYSGDRQITALYKLMGRQGIDRVKVRFEVGQGDGAPVATATGRPSPTGELPLDLSGPLAPGNYWGRLALVDDAGQVVDREQVEFRVIDGPFLAR